MRIDAVVAEAFGPLSRQRLELSPGLNVVLGPNEAGKTSWFAATYAGLCGVRRARGKPTREMREFRERHKPWRGSAWQVAVELSLASGEQVKLTQNLARGSSVGENLATRRPYPVSDLMNEGMADGAALLGLNRSSARATIFVGQADVLRVLEYAEELQEFLQRAAATSAADSTVEHALEELAESRRTRVGKAHIRSRPLGRAMAELKAAERSLDIAGDAHEALQESIVKASALTTKAGAADAELRQLEHLRRWQEVLQLEERTHRAQELTDRLGQLQSVQEPEPDHVRAGLVHALRTYASRGNAPEQLRGEAAEHLEAQLAALPPAPTGDLEPHATVTAAQSQHTRLVAQVESHAAARPDEPDTDAPSWDSDQLRSWAVTLDREPPTPRTDLEEELESRRAAERAARERHEAELASWRERRAAHADASAAYAWALGEYQSELATYEQALRDVQATQQKHAEQSAAQSAQKRRGAIMLVIGLMLGSLSLGLTLLVPPVGVLGLVVAIVLGIAGFVTRRSAPEPDASPQAAISRQPPVVPQPPTEPDPGPEPQAPVADRRIAELEFTVSGAAEAVRQYEVTQTRAKADLSSRGLPADPQSLRQLAREVEDAEGIAERWGSWSAQERTLEDGLTRARGRLAEALAARGEAADSEDLPAAFAAYLAACRSRSEQSAEAGRRPALEKALAARRQAEQRHSDQTAAWREAEARFRSACGTLRVGAGGADAEQLAVDAEAWLAEQARMESAVATRDRVAAELDGVLAGDSVAELEQQLAEGTAGLGDRPAAVPEDVEELLGVARRRRDALREQANQAKGQARSLAESQPSLAEAREREDEARRRLDEVQRTDLILSLTENRLRQAKERVNSSIAPVLTRSLRPWLPRITGNRYSDVRVDPDTLQIDVRGPDGVFRDAGLLSQGTREQTYLLLTYALAEHLVTTDEVAPLILDDITVQCDEGRTKAMLELLLELSADRQVILFSQEREVAAWAEEHLMGERDQITPLPEAA